MNVIEYTPEKQLPPPKINVPRDMVLDFGKRKGVTVSWVAEQDTAYALWLMSQNFVRRRPQLWLCLRRHVGRTLVAQDAGHVA